MDGSAPSPLVSAIKDIVFASGAPHIARGVARTESEAFAESLAHLDGPRWRFLAACLRLEHLGVEAGAVARRIYSRSDLADEIAIPDAEAAARIIRVLNDVEGQEARSAIHAVCDLLAPTPGPDTEAVVRRQLVASAR